MEANWLNEEKYEQYILAGDIGGTNTNLALVGQRKGKFTIMYKAVYRSADVTDILEPLREVLTAVTAKSADFKPSSCCISGAGPVENNVCRLTNCDWAIDGQRIQEALHLPTLVINDFLAIGYGIPTLDVNDPSQITKLPHPDGSYPQSQPRAAKAVVGAGTGLGVGYLVAADRGYYAYPSEGGHSGFAAFDEETAGLKKYLTDKFGWAPGTEPFVSGQGITNAYHYYRDVKKIEITGILSEIDRADDDEKPALIAQHAGDNDVCRRIMQLFVKMYGAFASSLSLIFLPLGGMYLAGGIVTKNEALFQADNLFMRYFGRNYRPSNETLLQKIPVYIIRDYSISLYGAANAAATLIDAR